jgi:hypothetical protein
MNSSVNSVIRPAGGAPMSATSTGLGKWRRGVLGPRWNGRDSFTLREVSEIFVLSAVDTYSAVKRGEIPAFRIGNKLRVTRPVVESLMEG